MSALVDKLFDKKQADAIRKLWKDRNSRFLIQKEIGKQLIRCESVIEEIPLTQIMFITSTSSFANSENECYDIAGIIYWGLNKTDILPMVTKHQGEELGKRCLISLGFFGGVIAKKYERYGAPSPSFYRNIGTSSFYQSGKDDIGDHFSKWELFMQEFFV